MVRDTDLARAPLAHPGECSSAARAAPRRLIRGTGPSRPPRCRWTPRAAGCSSRQGGGGRLELGDSVEVAVGVLEPGHAILAQCGDPLLVRLDPITLDLLEADAVGGELVHGALEVVDLPGGDRATRLACVGGRGVDVDLAAPAARIGDPAVADIPASRKAELALVELLRFGQVRHRQRRLGLCVTQTHYAPPAGTRSWSECPPPPSSHESYGRGALTGNCRVIETTRLPLRGSRDSRTSAGGLSLVAQSGTRVRAAE